MIIIRILFIVFTGKFAIIVMEKAFVTFLQIVNLLLRECPRYARKMPFKAFILFKKSTIYCPYFGIFLPLLNSRIL